MPTLGRPRKQAVFDVSRGLMKHTHQILVAVLGLTLLPALAVSADLPDPRDRSLEPSERLAALLERCRAEQAEIQTLEARFEQRKESALLLEPSVSRGVFSYSAPDRVRWEYQAPEAISMVIAQDELTTWYRDLEKVERAQVGGRSQRVLEYLGAGSSLDDLSKYFTVSLLVPEAASAAYRLELTPRFERVAKRLRGLEIWIDPELYLPVGLRYVEADGDVTEYRFENYRVNAPLPEDRFVLELPSGIDIETVELEARSAAR